eukprot:4596363-Prorocentrum_lima.AAC.1
MLYRGVASGEAIFKASRLITRRLATVVTTFRIVLAVVLGIVQFLPRLNAPIEGGTYRRSRATRVEADPFSF